MLLKLFRPKEILKEHKTLNLRGANFCLDCEGIHDQEECPVCLSKYYYPLRKWIPLLFSFEEIKEERKNGNKTSNISLQEKSEKSLCIDDHLNNIDYDNTDKTIHECKVIPTNRQRRLIQNNCVEPLEPWPRKSNHNSGKQLEPESYIIQGCNWINASFTRIRQTLCRYLTI